VTTNIFLNLPVRDLEKSKAFFESLGFTIDPRFTDDKAACVVISDRIHAQLLTREYFETFATKPVADAHQSTEVLIALGLDSRTAVDEIVSKALEAGGREPRPKQDHGFMVVRAFEDLDGHTWEVLWMDPSQAPPAPPAP